MTSTLKPEDFNVSGQSGFLPTETPLERLPDPYYEPWERIVKNLQGLILSKRLRDVVDDLEILSTDRLAGDAQWHRAYSVLAFIVHAYIWSGDKPLERVPPPVSIPFLTACKHLELPPVATYAGLVLWNWKPIFDSERSDSLDNLDTIDTFTGSLDEKWFYLVSIAIEARAGPAIPLMLRAIQAANEGDRTVVTDCLHQFAELLDELGTMLLRMYDQCDPHVFYHRIRPFLAGSKDMAEAGLPNGVVFDDGGPVNKQRYAQYSGGSNAQSSVIQFFDIVLDIQHRPTGLKNKDEKPTSPQPNFIHEMRKYMPGPHARFLEQVSRVANVRSFVQDHKYDRGLALAFDACLAMLKALRDKHIQMVTRYIVIKGRETKREKSQKSERAAEQTAEKVNLATATKPQSCDDTQKNKDLTGTGGTSLIPFLRQARDETGEPAVDSWTQRILSNNKNGVIRAGDRDDTLPGLAGAWKMDEKGGGLCLY